MLIRDLLFFTRNIKNWKTSTNRCHYNASTILREKCSIFVTIITIIIIIAIVTVVNIVAVVFIIITICNYSKKCQKLLS